MEWIAAAPAATFASIRGGHTAVPPGAGNFADRNAQPLVSSFLAEYDDGHAATAPVGSFAPDAGGFFDLAATSPNGPRSLHCPACKQRGRRGSVAVGDGALRVIRGSSWKHSAVTELRLAYRDYGDGNAMTSASASRVTRSRRSLQLALLLFASCLAVVTVLRAQEPAAPARGRKPLRAQRVPGRRRVQGTGSARPG